MDGLKDLVAARPPPKTYESDGKRVAPSILATRAVLLLCFC